MHLCPVLGGSAFFTFMVPSVQGTYFLPFADPKVVYACAYVFMYVCMYVFMFVYVCIYLCMYVCIHVCMYVYMYVCFLYFTLLLCMLHYCGVILHALSFTLSY